MEPATSAIARNAGACRLLADALEAVDDDRCPALLVEALTSLVEVDMAMSVVYSGRERPQYVWDTFKTERARRGLSNYIDGTYVVNPFYVAYRQGLGEGVYRMRDLARRVRLRRDRLRSLPAELASSEEIGYVTTDWPLGMQEVDLAVRLPGGACAEMSLSRAASMGGFTEQDLLALQGITPLVASIYRRYWAGRRARTGCRGTGSTAVERVLDRLGHRQLSPREHEVADLLLRGWRAPAVADELGISVTTVKTHRKNLYSKLGVASQSELFARLLTAG